MAILICAIDGTYWARYVAYFYFVPIMALIGLFFNTKDKKQIIAGSIISILMVVNIAMIAYASFNNILTSSKYVGEKLGQFRDYAQTQEVVIIKLNEEGFQSVCYNIDDLEVENYEIDQSIETTRDGLFFSY